MSDEQIDEIRQLLANGTRVPNPIVVIDLRLLESNEDLITNIEIKIWDRLSFGWVKV